MNTADMVFDTPFYHAFIEDYGHIEVIVTDGSVDRVFHVVGNDEDPEMVTRAINLLWQVATYGIADPAYKDDTLAAYDCSVYDEGDVQRFVDKMVAMGVLPENFHVRSIH